MKFFSIVLTVLLISSCSNNVSSQNIAFNKKYMFSEEPNYSSTRGSDDKDLTDGQKKTGNRFWQTNSTVGWANRSEIQIDLDLESIFSIEGILINTARNTDAEVDYPLNCLVFSSIDNKEFIYGGDLMLHNENVSGLYKVSSFKLDQLDLIGQYVKLVITTKSKFVFLDEIEVFGSQFNLGRSDLSQYKSTNKIVQIDDMKRFIKESISESASLQEKYVGIKAIQTFIGDSENIKEFQIQSLTKQSLLELEDKVKNEKNELQLRSLPSGIVFTPVQGIKELRTFSLKDVIQNVKETKSNQIDKVESLPRSFFFMSLINNDSKEKEISFEIEMNSNSEVYEVLPVTSLKGRVIWDALRPINNRNSVLKSGENKFFVITNFNGGFTIKNIVDNSIVKKVERISSESKRIDVGKNKLHVNVWAYLDKPLLSDNKNFVLTDLENAGVDVIVVHSAFIDKYGTKDFLKLREYLSQFKKLDNKKILIFNNLKSNAAKKFNAENVLDDKWKTNFKSWYDLMIDELSKIGVDKNEIYFYPYDEIKPHETSNFIELTKWGKASINNFKTFVTIVDDKSLEVSSYADIVQLSNFQVQKSNIIKSKEFWMYHVFDHSREKEPYKDYRLMAWNAYYNDLTGVGFWNYSALKASSEANYNVALNGSQDYSVLYLDENDEVLSSLRWRYFIQGIQDYQVLKNYENKIGKEKMKAIVKDVLDNYEDQHRADKTIQYFKFKF
ncbi:glycoside hydrolase domain-containing protein [Myroides sp. ZB35]|uniref:glycoside hydrolase domain-containing protein n=1 Tax=Myroides sp. ZB35 TaxID=1458492 RepID=UPI0008F4BE8A|nr:glycoside hydrolase domain-containing protein [Myroides sp. ZB35]APA93619.1 hypothetical protein BK054_15575 [Myroides sp. ZB35]